MIPCQSPPLVRPPSALPDAGSMPSWRSRSARSHIWLSGWAASPCAVIHRCMRCHSRPQRIRWALSSWLRTAISPKTGAVARYPDIKFIWSHGGGTIPYITSRLQGVGGKLLPKGVNYELQKFYYDTAQAFNANTMPSFRKFIPVSQILFGTDFPLGGGSAAIVAKGLKDNGGFTDAELRAVERENALKLLPRLKT